MSDVLSLEKALYTLYCYMDDLIGKQLEDEEKERVRRYHQSVLCDPRMRMNAPLAEFWADGRLKFDTDKARASSP
jgi:hypothetical protein